MALRLGGGCLSMRCASKSEGSVAPSLAWFFRPIAELTGSVTFRLYVHQHYKARDTFSRVLPPLHEAAYRKDATPRLLSIFSHTSSIECEA